MRRRGFTLVELLVVIAIIMLLVALLLPVMRSMRAMAMRVGCSSNMQQLSLGFHMYTNDNAGILPSLRNLFGLTDWLGYTCNKIPQGGTVYPYVLEARLYLCPADSKWRSMTLNPWLLSNVAQHSYAIPYTRECKPLALFGPAHALMVDESERTINDGLFVNNWDTFASRHRISGWGLQDRAGAGGNILFCDGRVEFFKATDIIGADNAMFQ